MKYVVKGAEPRAFSEWKAGANDAWQPSYGALQNPEKRALHAALLAEQHGVCCYCGRAISSADSHIEHFRPQRPYKHLALSYDNLHASCIRETKPGLPLHCGHAKDDDFDEGKAISPLDPGCEQRFLYALDGAVYPARPNEGAAHYMIDLLRLDLAFLRDRRAQALQGVFDAEFVLSANDDELRKLIHGFRQADADGQLLSFGHVLARYAEQLLAPASSTSSANSTSSD